MFVCTNQEQNQLKMAYKKALEDEHFLKFIRHLGLTEEEAMKKTTKLQDSLKEANHCSNCKGLYECKNAFLGHISMPLKDEFGLYFTYVPCKYKKKEVKLKKEKQSEEKINENARMKDIDVTDKKRVSVIKWLDSFYESFDFSKKMKGLYLHGNFGCGKTFLVSALLNELEEKKMVQTKIVYFPSFLQTLKADWDLYDGKMKIYQMIDILCIDDIGAEKVSEWSRDEVLGSILQYRMNHNLPTFFTSNLSLDELETHFQMNASAEEKMKARRIMERIRQLTEDRLMLSENRRG